MLKKKSHWTHTLCVCARMCTRLCICMHAKSLQSCLTLCDPMDCSLLGSSVHGDSPGKITGVGCPLPGDLPDPGIALGAPALQADSLPDEPPRKPTL